MATPTGTLIVTDTDTHIHVEGFAPTTRYVFDVTYHTDTENDLRMNVNGYVSTNSLGVIDTAYGLGSDYVEEVIGATYTKADARVRGESIVLETP